MSKTAEAQAESVGALLRQSRELKGLTTTDVATHLRLKVSQIEQIEAEEWDPAVSATFMRGYLRAYARFLKMPEKEILQNFELQTAYLRNQAKPMHSFSRKNRLDAVDNRFMLATYLLVVLLIGLFLIWFWQTHILDSQPVSVVPEYRVSADQSLSQSAEPSMPSSTEVATNREHSADLVSSTLMTQANTPADQNTTSPLPVTNSAETQPVLDEVTPTDQSLPADTSVAQIGNALAAPSTPALVQASDTAALANVSEGEQRTGNDQSVVQEQTVDTSVTPSDISVTATVNAAQLQMSFNADCWVTVQDATGKRLVYGMKAAGEVVQLTGQLPFSVTLGNAAAASVKLNQTAVDLSGYQAGQVARLTLNGQP